MRPRFFLAGGLLLAAVVAAPLVAAPASASGSAAPAIAFSTPTVVDPIHTWGEPDVAINPVDGTYYSSGPTGTGTQRSMWEMSRDGGHSFRPLNPNYMPNALLGTNAPPGGGDTDIAFDHTGRQYFSDLYALTCFRMATTRDDGATISQDPYPGGCAGEPGADRQWFATFDPPGGVTKSAYQGPFPVVYMEYNDLGASASDPAYTLNCEVVSACAGAQWVVSKDSGQSWTGAGSFGERCCPDGYPSVDQQTGQVFQVDDYNGSSALQLNIGTVRADGSLKWLSESPADAGNLITAVPAAWMSAHGSPDDLFPVTSMDSAQNLWVFFVTENPDTPALQQVWVTVASAESGWRTWSPPFQVSDGSTRTGDAVNLMPWIKAGGAGWADGVWYGSGPGTDGALADANSDAGQAWNVFMSQLRWPVDSRGGVITTRRPSRTLVRVSPHPMHYNDICELGTDCIKVQGNRNLADFFNLSFDAQGAAVIVYDDTSNQLLQPGFPTSEQALDHAGAPVVTIAHQSAGMGLYGHTVHGASSAPVAGLGGARGDALYPVVGGANVDGLDLVGSSVALSPDGGTLDVSMKVADLSDIGGTAQAVNAPLLSYVTRWVMHGAGQDTVYYAEMETDASGASPQFYAGQAQSVDLCSVSACFPHVITYPEAGPGSNSVGGTVDCSSTPCTVTIHVPVADIGSPTPPSRLEEVGAYSFAESHPMAATTNAQAQLDSVPVEVDGICCYDYRQASVQPQGSNPLASVLSAVAQALGFEGKGNMAPGATNAEQGQSGQPVTGSGTQGGSPGSTGPGAHNSRLPIAVHPTASPVMIAGLAVLVLLLGLAGWTFTSRRGPRAVEQPPADQG